jgi:hypothetical protein
VSLRGPHVCSVVRIAGRAARAIPDPTRQPEAARKAQRRDVSIHDKPLGQPVSPGGALWRLLTRPHTHWDRNHRLIPRFQANPHRVPRAKSKRDPPGEIRVHRSPTADRTHPLSQVPTNQFASQLSVETATPTRSFQMQFYPRLLYYTGRKKLMEASCARNVAARHHCSRAGVIAGAL